MTDVTHSPSNRKILPEVRKPPDIIFSPLEETLICNVHAGYQKIIVEKEFRGNYGGARVFLVLPVNVDGSTDARLITKIGPTYELTLEQENYRQLVAKALPFSAARVGEYCVEEDQAALNYDFAGGGVLGETITLAEYYAHGTAEIQATLEALLDDALGAWYRESHPLHTTFRDEYGGRLPSEEEMLRVVSMIFPDLGFPGRERIEIPGTDGSYPNPLIVYLSLLDKVLEGRESYVHGDLHLRNVLVDQDGRAWLIDFANVAKHHTMLDFIKLETYTRIMILAPQHRRFSWDDYAQLEYTLNAGTLGQKVLHPSNSHLAKAYSVIQTIRQIARKYMAPDQDFRKEYFPALFLYCLARLKHYESNGLVATQMIFMTACALAQSIFDESKAEDEMFKFNSGKSEEQLPGKAFRPGGVSIGGNARDNVIITGNQNTVGQVNRKVNTGGGAYVEGNVHVQGGDFVGRDKHVIQNSGASADEIARAFVIIMDKVNREKDNSKREKAQRQVQKLETEARRGDDVDRDNVEDGFAALASTSADAWDVAVATLSSPIAGISTIFQKIVQRIKNEGK